MEEPVYDKESVYDEQIAPLMTKILEICKANKIPMVASFAYANNEDEGVAMCSSYLDGPNKWEPEIFMAARKVIYRPPMVSTMVIISKAIK